MRPGHWTSAAPGSTPDMILDGPNIEIASGGLSARVTFTPVAGYGDRYWAVYVNARKAAVVWVAEGGSGDIVTPLLGGGSDVSVYVEDCGGWAAPFYNPNWGALEMETDTSGVIHFRFAGRWTYAERGDSGGQLSGWALSGLKRWSNIAPVADWPTRGELGVVLSDSAGTRTVELYSSGVKVASGSRSGDGVITLVEANSSGVSGSVTVAYTADIALSDGVVVEARWPKEYQIHYSTSPLSFPRTPEATVSDGGNRNVYTAESAELAAGTYYVAVIAVSDTGIEDTATTASGTVIIAGPPEAPGAPAYSSGDITATVITWTPSATAGVTYSVYDSDLDEPIDLLTPVSASAVSPYTLPTKSGQEPGKRRILVRATKAGAEEKNLQWLVVEYDAAGARVAPRPNTPEIQSVAASAGRKVTVTARYESSGEDGTATEIQLFIWAYGGTANYASPSATAALATVAGTLKGCAPEYTVAADGWYYVGIRAATAGGVQDENTTSRLVYLSNELPADVADFEAIAARG